MTQHMQDLAAEIVRLQAELDREIEARLGVPVTTIFELEGEAGFRRRESELIEELTRRSATVLATGGGAVLDPANRQSNVVVHQGKRRHYYAFPYRDYYIWGATAGMLMNFQAFLRA